MKYTAKRISNTSKDNGLTFYDHLVMLKIKIICKFMHPAWAARPK